MATERAIPEELVDAFRSAIEAYIDLANGRPEQPVRYQGKEFSIGAIADLVSDFDDKMPNDVAQLLVGYASLFGRREFFQRPAGKTFAGGGRLLLYMYDRKRRA